MNLGILALLVFINFTWTAPAPEDQVTKVEIRVATAPTDYANAQLIDAGLPPVVNGKQAYQSTIDITTPKWFWVQGRNSFGLSDVPAPVKLGKPQQLVGVQATP